MVGTVGGDAVGNPFELAWREIGIGTLNILA